MARKLKTYQTSLGFFEQAIAAPSMKAALEAGGADSNLFHQGAAKESTDPDVIAHEEVGRRPRNHQFARQRNHPPRPTRRRIGRSGKRTNGSDNAASARKPRKRRPGRSSANAGSTPSTRRKRLWTRRSRSTRDVRPRCVPKSRRL